mmetsp:Transcript_29449/g.71764  ORF Transcript_29449/g.71764 Transcript_29449/m.71764 type:complete len:1182 (-) Transcript_29449:327-3872(-)
MDGTDVHLLASDSHSNGTESHGGHGDETSGLAVMFLSFSLLAGTLLWTIVDKLSLPIPYTVLMLILGMIIGATNLDGGNGSNWFHEGMEMYASIDPHLLLQVFLPALIFESSFSASYHIIKREIGQALLLAGPGVAISMILSAVVARYFLTYSWDWTTALLFGSILSATDPVAVVALLRDLGVSKKLATLIEGESLFNDGTAFVMFLVWIEFLEGNELTAGEIVVYMLQLAVGGFFFGIACAIPALAWLSAIQNPAVETTITFGVAYLCFWLAESSQAGIHVSGVLAIVALGISMNRFKFFISVQAEETVHHFWEMIGFVANTLIFFISGIVVVQRVFGGNENIRAVDFGFALMIYVMIHVVRAITIALLFPFMTRMGYGFDWRQATVLCYGGLRGAVGLALALIVDLNDEIDDEISDLILFHVAAIVALTLLVNGSTTGLVLKWVGLKKVSPSKQRAYRKAIESIKESSEKQSMKMRREKMFSMADWALVRKHLPEYEHKTRDLALANVKEIPFHLNDHEIARMYKSKATLDLKGEKPGDVPLDVLRQKTSQMDTEELRKELMHRLLTAMSSSFTEAYEEGQISRAAIPILSEATETALDYESLGVLWETIDHYFCINPVVEWMFSWWPYLASKYYLRRFELSVDMAVSFIHALRVIDKVELFHEFANNKIYEEIVDEVAKYREKAQARWDQIEMDFPNLYNAMQTLFAIRRLLESERRAIRKLHHKGIIDENEKQKLEHALDQQQHWIENHSIDGNDHRVTSAEIIAQIDFWDYLPKDLQKKLQRCKRFAVTKGHKVIHNHKNVRLCYVMQGILKVKDEQIPDSGHTLGIGSLYGAWSALNHRSRFFAEAHSQSDPVVILEIEKTLLCSLMKIPDVRDALWRTACADVLTIRHPHVFRTSWRKAYHLCQGAVLREAKEDTVIGVQHLVVLLRGDAVRKHITEKKKTPDLKKGFSELKLASTSHGLGVPNRDNGFKAKSEMVGVHMDMEPVGDNVFTAPELLTLQKGEFRCDYKIKKGTVYMIFKNVAPAIYRSTNELHGIPTHHPDLNRTTTTPEKNPRLSGNSYLSATRRNSSGARGSALNRTSVKNSRLESMRISHQSEFVKVAKGSSRGGQCEAIHLSHSEVGGEDFKRIAVVPELHTEHDDEALRSDKARSSVDAGTKPSKPVRGKSVRFEAKEI